MKKLPDIVFLGFFVVIFIGIYTSITVDVGAGTVLAAPALAVGALLALLYWRQILPSAWKIAIMLALAVLPTFLATFVQLPFERGALSVVMMTASVGMSLAVLVGLNRTNLKLLLWLLGLMVFTFIVTAFLETHTAAVKSLSDGVRRILYSHQLQFFDDSRDLKFYGAARAKVFSQEASFPAKATAFLIAGYLALARTRLQWIVGIILLGGSLYIFRSPEMMSAVILVAGLVFLRIMQRQKVPPAVVNVVIALAIVGVFVISLDAQAVAGLIGGKRGMAISNGTDGSTVERILLPPQVFLATLHKTWLGMGLGAKQTVDPIVREMANNFPQFVPVVLPDQSIVWGDGFYDLFISLGPIFAIAFIAAMCWLYRSRYFLMPAMLFSMVFLLDPGAPNPRNWFYLALLVATFNLGLTDRKALASAPRQPFVQQRPAARKRVVAQAALDEPEAAVLNDVAAPRGRPRLERQRIRPEPRRRVVKTDTDQTPDEKS